MSRAFLFLLILCGCATSKKYSSLIDVAKVEPGTRKSSIEDVLIEEAKDSKISEKKTVVLFLSKKTSLCIPEFLLIENVEVKLAQVRSIYLMKYFQKNGSEWNRFYLVEKTLKANQNYSIISKENIESKIFYERYFALSLASQNLSELEKELRLVHQKTIKKLGKKSFEKGEFVIASDIDLKGSFKNFLKISSLKDVNSFMRIKKQCESISGELVKKLNISV